MKRILITITVLISLASFAFADNSPNYIGTWCCVFNVSDDSTTFVIFQLTDDHAVYYSSQFFYKDRAGMTEKGVWSWEEINDKYFRIHASEDRLLYFEMIDSDHLDAGNDLIYERIHQEK
jgi:hypothetical protein